MKTPTVLDAPVAPTQADALSDGPPGVGVPAVPKIPEIESAAITYKNIRDKRMLMTKEEGEAKKDLLAAMKKHALETYYFDDQEVLFTEKENVKVRTLNSDGHSSDD